MTVIRCTSTVLRATGYRPCLDKAVWIATDPETGEKYYRCEQHAQRCVRSFGFTLQRISEPREAVPGDICP